MEVEGGDGIKGLTRLGWHTLLRHAVQPGLSVHPVTNSVCAHASLRDGRALRTHSCVPPLQRFTLPLLLLQLQLHSAAATATIMQHISRGATTKTALTV